MNKVNFTLPSLPGSVNRIYVPGYSIYSRKPEWSLSPDWMHWQTRMAPYIPRFEITAGSLVHCDALFYYNYYYKTQKTRLRIVDTQNMLKLLLDTIAKKCGWNDALIKSGSWESRHSESGKVEVTLREIEYKREITNGSGDEKS